MFSAFSDLAIRYLPQSKKQEGFAFLVHPRGISDLYRKYPFFKYLPKNLVERIIMLMWPVTLASVDGLVSKKNGEKIRGYIVSITMTSEQMLKNRKHATKKITSAVKLAKKKGAMIIGLGSLSSPVMSGGADLVGKHGIFITNGNALTAGMTLLGVKEVAKKRKVTLSKSIIAVVGATGSVGQTVSKLLVRDYGIARIIIIGS